MGADGARPVHRAADVLAAVRFARERELVVAVRFGRPERGRVLDGSRFRWRARRRRRATCLVAGVNAPRILCSWN